MKKYGGYNYSDYINGYRADPTGKFGGKDRMETMPYQLDRNELYNSIRALEIGKKYGTPNLSEKQIANMVLHEGREDLGFNHIDFNNPKSAKLQKLISSEPGMDSLRVAGLPIAVLEKYETAKRLGIPFETLWNGTGKSSQTGRTGKDYQKEAEAMRYAAEHPKNNELIDFINKAKTNSFSPQEQIANDINEIETYYKHTGMDRWNLQKYLMDNTSGPLKNTIKNINPDILQGVVNNNFRNMNGIEPKNMQGILANGIPDPKGRIGKYYFENDKNHSVPTAFTEASMIVNHPDIKPLLEKIHQPILEKYGVTQSQQTSPTTDQGIPLYKYGGFIGKPLKGSNKLI
jgi:hypothetical protein